MFAAATPVQTGGVKGCGENQPYLVESTPWANDWLLGTMGTVWFGQVKRLIIRFLWVGGEAKHGETQPNYIDWYRHALPLQMIMTAILSAVW